MGYARRRCGGNNTHLAPDGVTSYRPDPMRAFLFGFAMLLVCPVLAAEPAAVTGTLTLRHASVDRWHADYHFDEAIDAVEFGPAVVDFRREAWRLRTPDVALASIDGNELVRSEDRAFRTLRIDLRQYDAWAHDAYVPMDRHSDGGTAIYLGHFMGRVRQGGVERNLKLRIRLQGLPGETTFLPVEANRDLGVYAYFGPQAITETGALRTLIDPAMPAWIRAALSDTASRLAMVYADKLGRPAPDTLALIVGAKGLDQPGYSLKGGALPGQIVYKIEGRDLVNETPQGRRQLQQLAAHELAHVWQGLVTRGGIGDTQPWVHEGGAEALSLLALQQSGLWTDEHVADHAKRLKDECLAAEEKRAADPALTATWRDNYTCGFARFDNAGIDAFTLWKRLMLRTEAGGEPYSERMFAEALEASDANDRAIENTIR